MSAHAFPVSRSPTKPARCSTPGSGAQLKGPPVYQGGCLPETAKCSPQQGGSESVGRSNIWSKVEQGTGEGQQTINPSAQRVRRRRETVRRIGLERQFRTKTITSKFLQELSFYAVIRMCPVALQGQIPSVKPW